MPRFIAEQTYTELFVAGSLDSLLGPDAMVRVLWATLLEQDLASFEAAAFTHNAATDTLTCPPGQPLAALPAPGAA